jgi:RES domain-containing protein
MIVYRLAKKIYCTDLSGTGAELTGGRWNFKGTRVLYTADSRALCMAEIAVHTPIGIIPRDYFLIMIEFPDETTGITIDDKSLPDKWNSFPYSQKTQKIGDDLIKGMEYLYIKVPSAVVQGDFNILINPLHKEFSNVKIVKTEKFDFDERLFK